MKVEYLLAMLVFTGYYTLQWFVLTHIPVDQAARDLVIRLLGNSDAAFMITLTYFFGATKAPPP